VALFDNLSHLQDWAIDILCRLVTGEGDSKRRLYSDDEDVIYELKRLVLVNGINPPADRPDFTDRCLPIELERLDDDKRMPEEALWALAAQDHPKWLGAVLTLLSKALACRARVKLSRFPRLADWGTFAAAVYEAAGDGAEQFLTDWQWVVKKQHQAVIEGSPGAQALLTFMDQREWWSGTASQLYDRLTPVVEELKLAHDRAWPRSAKGLGRRLGELQPVLKDLGLICERARTPGGDRDRIVTLNKGWNDATGNPPNPGGLKTDYLWREILTREGLTDIMENYAQVVEEKDERTGRKWQIQIFPRYHQLDVIRKLLADARQRGAGRRYLIQHSAGSGKSNSIAWLAHQLVGLQQGTKEVFDSVVVVTDRRVLDKQIRDTIKQFAQVAADKAYQNAMKHSDKQNARIEHDKALQRVLVELLADHTELFKQFSDNPGLKKWLTDTIFAVTYTTPDT
jgi:hypothetical protein